VAYLEIPQDVFTAQAEPESPPWPTGHQGDAAPQSDHMTAVALPDAVDRAVDALARAARPVAVAGSGAFFSGAGEALAAFVERTAIPVTTTSAARGLIDDGYARCLGSLVHGGIALASADVALVLGSRFNANLLYGGLPLFPPGQIVIQVDVLADHLGGQRRPEIGVVADVSAFVGAVTAAWPGEKTETHAAWAEQAAGGAAASRSGWEAETERSANGVHPGWLARETARFADEASGGRSTFVCDGGDSVLWGIAFARARRPGTHLFIGSAMGTLGIGLPFATAARIARPDEPAVLFTGDGAFGLSLIELDTCVRHGIGVVVVVANNGGWGDVRHEQRVLYGEEAASLKPSAMRYDLVAEAAGGYGERVTEHDQVWPALERALEAAEEGVPAVVDAATDPDALSDLMRNLAGLNVM
jgi:acetolactate synthase-1/2/3 large subunit